jgi:hypothetical protein
MATFVNPGESFVRIDDRLRQARRKFRAVLVTTVVKPAEVSPVLTPRCDANDKQCSD